MNPGAAGEVALGFLRGGRRELIQAEVMDVDEHARREGAVSPVLHGYMCGPSAGRLVQSAKSGSTARDGAAQQGIARFLVETVLRDGTWFLGPGTTTKAVFELLGLEKTVLGVDAVRGGALVARDADERALLDLAAAGDTRILVTQIGGQGFVFGRGNPQFSPRVLKRVAPPNIVIAATQAKIAALGGRALLVDTGDRAVDEMLCGYAKIVTGYRREIVYRVES